jgi:hypothetical protein
MHHQTCFFDVEGAWVERSAFLVEKTAIESIADKNRDVFDVSRPCHIIAQLHIPDLELGPCTFLEYLLKVTLTVAQNVGLVFLLDFSQFWHLKALVHPLYSSFVFGSRFLLGVDFAFGETATHFGVIFEKAVHDLLDGFVFFVIALDSEDETFDETDEFSLPFGQNGFRQSFQMP